MPTRKVFLTKKEVDQIKDCVETMEAGRFMMREGAMLTNSAEKSMWEKIKEIAPKAIKFTHPRTGKWSFEIKEKENAKL